MEKIYFGLWLNAPVSILSVMSGCSYILTNVHLWINLTRIGNCNVAICSFNFCQAHCTLHAYIVLRKIVFLAVVFGTVITFIIIIYFILFFNHGVE